MNSAIGPGWVPRRRRKPGPMKRRALRRLLKDVEHLAEVAADTVERLDAAGLEAYARPLEAAVIRLAGRQP